MHIISQPFDGGIGACLLECLRGDYHSFRFAVAYARTSGTDILLEPMRRFVRRGGRVSASVGLDQKHTSGKALESLLTLAAPLYVFHNELPNATFHPKLYLFEGEGKAVAFIGSNNLTVGGLATNYELAVRLDYDLTQETEQAAYRELLDGIAPYFEPGPCCLPVDAALLARLYAQSYIRQEEDEPARAAGAKRTEPIFGSPASGTVAEGRRRSGAPTLQLAKGPAGFWKRLSRNDVSVSSSPGQIIIPIQFKDFFEPFANPQQTPAGATQSERFLDLCFRSPDGTEVLVENARAILYIPAPNHPRQNREIRFTFRNRSVFNQLREGDVLKFERAETGGVCLHGHAGSVKRAGGGGVYQTIRRD